MQRTRSIGATRESRQSLRRWYRHHKRDLPWRRTNDPYAVWISEIMLQQTRVRAVIPYYERFLKRFPDVGVLARAQLHTILAQWSGLGYYRRARHLHAAAKILARDGFPNSSKSWRSLPGVGAYTAAAVASISLGEPAAVVDGNVERVLSRLHALPEDSARIREIADAWVPVRAPGEHNQAIMELGATVCTPRSPRCGECPIRGFCAGKETPERFPNARPRPKPIQEERSIAFMVRAGKVKLVRNEGSGRLEGMWDLPRTRAAGPVLATVKHSILDRRLTLLVKQAAPRGKGDWFSAKKAASLPLTASARKCLKEVGFL